MIFHIKLIIVLITSLVFQNCSSENAIKKRDGLIVYQEAQIYLGRETSTLSALQAQQGGQQSAGYMSHYSFIIL
tara:strand:+ start:36 stop:257 length:222 start_codon:yes stop_codon:yes gene_type:complete